MCFEPAVHESGPGSQATSCNTGQVLASTTTVFKEATFPPNGSPDSSLLKQPHGGLSPKFRRAEALRVAQTGTGADGPNPEGRQILDVSYRLLVNSNAEQELDDHDKAILRLSSEKIRKGLPPELRQMVWEQLFESQDGDEFLVETKCHYAHGTVRTSSHLPDHRFTVGKNIEFAYMDQSVVGTDVANEVAEVFLRINRVAISLEHFTALSNANTFLNSGLDMFQNIRHLNLRILRPNLGRTHPLSHQKFEDSFNDQSSKEAGFRRSLDTMFQLKRLKTVKLDYRSKYVMLYNGLRWLDFRHLMPAMHRLQEAGFQASLHIWLQHGAEEFDPSKHLLNTTEEELCKHYAVYKEHLARRNALPELSGCSGRTE